MSLNKIITIIAVKSILIYGDPFQVDTTQKWFPILFFRVALGLCGLPKATKAGSFP